MGFLVVKVEDITITIMIYMRGRKFNKVRKYIRKNALHLIHILCNWL